MLMLPDVATPRLQMKVSAMIRPNKVSEIRSIGSSNPKGVSETSDIESSARWLNLQGKFADYFGRLMMCRFSPEVKAIHSAGHLSAITVSVGNRPRGLGPHQMPT